MINNERKGFTLIEILIVVAIIAILASIVLVGLGPTQQSGRDARRLSDLHEVQNALELYYSKCGFYPGPVQAAGAGACATADTTGYADMAASLKTNNTFGVSIIPNDPTSGQNYLYATTLGGTSYVLAANLENANNSVFSSYQPPAVASYVKGDTITCAAPQYCITL